jgi:vacuolar protein sorting-associated protein 13A/C
MFETFLEALLNKYFGEYFVNLDKNAMSISIWKGEIKINNVQINPSILKEIKLPLTMKIGVIENLTILIPWKSLSTQAVEITMDGLTMILEIERPGNWEMLQQPYTDFVRSKLEEEFVKVWKSMEEKLESCKESKGNEGSSFFERVFDNLTVTIGEMEIRLETFGRPSNEEGDIIKNKIESEKKKNEFAFGGRI